MGGVRMKPELVNLLLSSHEAVDDEVDPGVEDEAEVLQGGGPEHPARTQGAKLAELIINMTQLQIKG